MSDFKLPDNLNSIIAKSLIQNQSESFYFKDLKSRFIAASQFMAEYFGVQSPDDMLGKTDFDYFTKEHAIQAYNDEQEIIRTGQPMLGVVEQETWDNDYISHVVTSKYPLYDDEGNIIGTWGHSVNVALTNKSLGNIKEPLLHEDEVMRDLTEDSRIDSLTNLKNTKAFYEFINLFYQKALNSLNLSDSVHSLILVDMNGFSMINETFGVKYGDEALKFAANILDDATKDTSHLFRYSGDKFAILTQKTGYDDCKEFAEEILRLFDVNEFESHGDSINLTASIGMSSFKESLPFGNIHDIINLTDKRLYAAKSKGVPTIIHDNSYRL